MLYSLPELYCEMLEVEGAFFISVSEEGSEGPSLLLVCWQCKEKVYGVLGAAW